MANLFDLLSLFGIVFWIRGKTDMKSVKSVYLMTDLEGVAGVDDWDPWRSDYVNEARGVLERSEMKRLLTGEVNAAAEGLFAAGVENILINDAHGGFSRTILPEELISGVRIARGTERPCWLVGFDSGFDAIVMVGMHPIGYTPRGCLAHTMARGEKYRVNGVEVGEMQIAAYLAGQLGVPWIFVSGDVHACRQAEASVPGIVQAPVKEGLSATSAIHMAPVDARNLLREQIQKAVANVDEIEPLRIDGPVTLERWREDADASEGGPGSERMDANTVRWKGEHFWQVFHHAFYGKPDLPLPL